MMFSKPLKDLKVEKCPLESRFKASNLAFYRHQNTDKTKSVAIGRTVGCRLLFEPAPGINENLDFLSFGKSYANLHFITKICDL